MLGSKQSLLVESVQRLLRRGAEQRVRHLLTKTRPEDVAHALPLLIRRERRQVFDLMEARRWLEAEALVGLLLCSGEQSAMEELD